MTAQPGTVTALPIAQGDAAWSPRLLRDVLGCFATGITVIATGDVEPVGMTTNSFASVSIDPALVLFCARLGSKVHRALSDDSTFSVNVLAGDHELVARHFASPDRGTGVRSFAPVRWQRGSRTDAPVIVDATASLECRVWNIYAGGDHLIYVGEVLALHRGSSPEHALVFMDGCYRRIARDPAPHA